MGVVTFSQSTNVWHANTLSDDDTSTLTLANAADLQVVVTDADGDKATAGIDLGAGVFQIEDDGPAVSGAVSSGTVDEDGVVEGIADAGPGDGIPGGPGDFVDPNTDGDKTSRRRRARLRPVPVWCGRAADLFAVDGYERSGGARSDVWRRCADLCGGRQRADGGGRAGNTVFTFSLNAATGAWTFNLEDQLDHPTLDGLPGDNTENDLTIMLGDRCPGDRL